MVVHRFPLIRPKSGFFGISSLRSAFYPEVPSPQSGSTSAQDEREAVQNAPSVANSPLKAAQRIPLKQAALAAFFQLIESLLKGGGAVAQIGGDVFEDDLPTGNCILLVADGGVATSPIPGRSRIFLPRVAK